MSIQQKNKQKRSSNQEQNTLWQTILKEIQQNFPDLPLQKQEHKAELKLYSLLWKGCDDISRVDIAQYTAPKYIIQEYNHMMQDKEVTKHQEQLSKTIYVSNLHHDIKKHHLRKFFQYCGEIDDIELKSIKCGVHLKTSALIQFAKSISSRVALRLNGYVMDGRPARIIPAKDTICTKICPSQKRVRRSHANYTKTIKNHH